MGQDRRPTDDPRCSVESPGPTGHGYLRKEPSSSSIPRSTGYVGSPEGRHLCRTPDRGSCGISVPRAHVDPGSDRTFLGVWL